MKHSNEKYAIGIDLGATKFDIGLINDKGKVLYKERFLTQASAGYPKILHDLVKAILSVKAKISEHPTIIGVGLAGQIDEKSGDVKFAPNLKWHKVSFKDDLEKEIKIPVKVTNDVRAAAWGEWIYGAGKGCNNLICLFIGTGIGGGIITNGQMVTGASNSAGELGHITIDLNGPICSCGNRGCFEAFAGGWAIEKRIEKLLKEHPEKSAGIIKFGEKNEKISPAHLASAVLNNDPTALEILADVQQALIAGCVGIINAFNPSCLVLGGGIIRGFPYLIPLIETGIRQYALKAATENLIVVPAQFQDESGIVGAAAWALDSLNARDMSYV